MIYSAIKIQNLFITRVPQNVFELTGIAENLVGFNFEL